MTPTEANDLAVRHTGGYPRRTNGSDVTVEAWVDVFTPLDVGRAGTTMIRLRNENDHAPSIAAFLRMYRSLHTASADQRCDNCAGDGTITGPTFQRHGHTYTSAIPCPSCEAGRTAQRWMHGYNDDRAARTPAPSPTAELATVHNLFDTQEQMF